MYPALILAGGASSRMGQDKASMIVGGLPMIVRVAHSLRGAGCSPIIVAVRNGYQRQEIWGLLSHLTEIEFVLDRGAERGVVSALQSALRVCLERGIDEIQLAPCDIPWVDSNIIKRLKREKDCPIVIPRSTRLEPLLALTDVQRLLQAIESRPPNSSLQNIMCSVPHRVIMMGDLEALSFKNINRPSDLA
ncbi:MAG: molybdenum cofactor guanylyltransferase [Candidatus Thalassarchaeaceae archaeon]|jgi:molybdopterin-guanine dinucleotide biosynthesis protein A|nr:molybdenum cofactor guanylyltransferase [Candidatus Thalassarchaeaceae archaeon]